MNVATAPEYSFWNLPQAMPTFLFTEPIDRLTEDEIDPVLDELEDAYAVEALIYGGAQ